jgi:PAS domain S-box-containing protein
MVTPYFSFGSEQFNRIFPFYILIDSELKIASYGHSFEKLCTLTAGELFTEHFRIRLPQIDNINSLRELTNKVVLLDLKGEKQNYILRGQFEHLDKQNQYLFIGTPSFASMDDVTENNLTLNDFAKHDNLIDQLHLLKEQKNTNEDVKHLSETTTGQKQLIKNQDNLLKFALKDDGIWYYDAKNKSHLNYHYQQTNSDFENLTYDSWLASIHEDDLERVKTSFENFINGTDQQFAAEHRWEDNNGHYKYYITRAFIEERDETGNPLVVIGIVSNIDQQKQLELRLKETANRLYFLIQNLDSAIVVEGKDRKIILVNDKFCQLLGIRESPEQLTGMNYTVATRQSKNLYKNPENVISRIYHVLEQKQIVLNELIELSDGRFFKRDYVPIYLDGKYEGHLWQYSDVTEQTIAEQKLEAQKQFYENVLNNIPADIVAFNPSHEYLFVNPTAIKDPELRKWMIGKKDEDFCAYRNKPVSIAEERRAMFNKVLNSKKLQFWEEKNINANGLPEYHLQNMYPVLNETNEVLQVIGFGLDITDRKKIEDQLKINEKRYRDLFNYSQAYICSHDLKGKILTVNPAICELLGLTQEELVGRMLTDFLPPEDIKNFYGEYLEQVVRNGTAKGVFRIIGKKDKKSFLLYKNFKVEEENSEPYIIGFSQDITDRILTEKELLVTKKVTEEAHKAKEIFLANMSHEIRTPMTGILGIANLLSKTALDDQQRKFTKLISESANNLLTIVNDVLDIEKIAAGRIDLENIPFKLEDKVFTTLQSFQFKAEDKNINLLLNSSLPDDLVVIGDPYRLSQILNNLLSNALKFTGDGEISINMELRNSKNQSVIVDISVQDTGIGIKKEKLSDIFNPFVQGSSDTTRKYGGTGLGLTICKNLVEMQGGKIQVASVENKGTTFSFFLPYQRGDIALLPKERIEDLNFKDLESIRILVAEDVELNQFLVKHILDSWGCEVTIVNNGKEAVDIIRTQYFDLILMDIQMPEMDGITATKLIRGLNIAEKPVIDKSLITKKIRTLNAKDKSNIPIIALTANALKGDGQRYMDIGMNGYITKPYTEEKLFSVINDVIRTNDKLRLKVAPLKNLNGPAPAPGPKLYDLSLINTIGKDDDAFAKKIVSIFLETMPESLEHLIKTARENNYEQMSKTAHKMKSSIDSMGITSLKETIRELEAVNPGNENTDLLIKKVASTLKEVFVQLKEVVS